MLITCEGDKTIKMWKENDAATPETHPLHFNPPTDMRLFLFFLSCFLVINFH